MLFPSGIPHCHYFRQERHRPIERCGDNHAAGWPKLQAYREQNYGSASESGFHYTQHPFRLNDPH